MVRKEEKPKKSGKSEINAKSSRGRVFYSASPRRLLSCMMEDKESKTNERENRVTMNIDAFEHA